MAVCRKGTMLATKQNNTKYNKIYEISKYRYKHSCQRIIEVNNARNPEKWRLFWSK